MLVNKRVSPTAAHPGVKGFRPRDLQRAADMATVVCRMLVDLARRWVRRVGEWPDTEAQRFGLVAYKRHPIGYDLVKFLSANMTLSLDVELRR